MTKPDLDDQVTQRLNDIVDRNKKTEGAVNYWLNHPSTILVVWDKPKIIGTLACGPEWQFYFDAYGS